MVIQAVKLGEFLEHPLVSKNFGTFFSPFLGSADVYIKRTDFLFIFVQHVISAFSENSTQTMRWIVLSIS